MTDITLDVEIGRVRSYTLPTGTTSLAVISGAAYLYGFALENSSAVSGGSITFTSGGNTLAIYGFPANSLSAYNPVVSTPAIPASNSAVQNPNNEPIQVVITGGTITAVVVNGITVGSAPGTYFVPAYGAISITYSVAPTSWAWSSANSNPVITSNGAINEWFGSPGVFFPQDLTVSVPNGTLSGGIFAIPAYT